MDMEVTVCQLHGMWILLFWQVCEVLLNLNVQQRTRRELEKVDSLGPRHPEYRYSTEFQSHEPEVKWRIDDVDLGCSC